MAAYDPNGLIIEIPNFWKSQGVDVLKCEYLYDKIQLNRVCILLSLTNER